MKTSKPSVLLAFCFAATIAASAGATPPPFGFTTLVMGAGIANGIVAPQPPSRVTVPFGEQVRMLAPLDWPFPIQWTKNGQPITGATESTLILPLTTPSDNGLYLITGAPFPTITTGISLDVAPAGHMANYSSRLELAPGGGVQIVGFVVSGNKNKSILVRAVGPSLAAYGVAKPVALPRIRFFDAAGNEMAFFYPAVVIDWGPIFNSVGAFPLTGGERERLAFTKVGFDPGAYTVQVSDDAKLGGTVLVEIYDLP